LYQFALHKKNGLKLGIIASCILLTFLFSYAENHVKAAKSGAAPANQNNRQAVSSKTDMARNIKQIQTLLALLKFNPGPIDGIPGRKTTDAIRAFQRDIGVPVTGRIDENLKSQLDGAYKLIVIRTQQQKRDDEVKPPTDLAKPRVDSNLPAVKPEKAIDSAKVLEVKQQKKSDMAGQKELSSKDQHIKVENQYLKYIKISFPVIAVIFLAYFYRIWTRSNEKKRGDKETLKAETETERPEKVNPEEEHEELLEVPELEKEKKNDAGGKAESSQRDPVDYQDPSHPGYITPVVRRKVWIRNKGQCTGCGNRKDLQYDYIVPTSEGGDNILENLQLLCKSCSQEKSVK
jgi:5-methylcytosine-specific restriction endonuclease McrA